VNGKATNPSGEQSSHLADAPAFSNLASSPFPTSATITGPRRAATSEVRYGPSSAIGDYPVSSQTRALKTAHSITVTGLDEETSYCFLAGSFDVSGNDRA
jgi:hypothetical protein